MSLRREMLQVARVAPKALGGSAELAQGLVDSSARKAA
jgi:hypothetical protein